MLSLRAGGVGLNLTTAKRVFMMDPWWSFAVEAQAIDRVHRMGQEDEVKVVRFIVAGSIEGRMLRIQERKKFMWVSLFFLFFFIKPLHPTNSSPCLFSISEPFYVEYSANILKPHSPRTERAPWA